MSREIDRAIQNLLPRLSDSQCWPLPPEQPADVISAFSKAGLIATTDIIQLYGAIGGMEGMDEEMWRLWPLAEIESEQANSFGVSFSCYLLACWVYRLDPVSSEVSAVYIDADDGCRLVAHSLLEFLQTLYLDPAVVLEPEWMRGPNYESRQKLRK